MAVSNTPSSARRLFLPRLRTVFIFRALRDMKLPLRRMVAGFCHVTGDATQPHAVVREFSANGLPVTGHPTVVIRALPYCSY